MTVNDGRYDISCENRVPQASRDGTPSLSFFFFIQPFDFVNAFCHH